MIDQPAAVGERVDVACQVLRADHVEDDVGAAAVGGRLQLLDEVLLDVVDGELGAEIAAGLQGLRAGRGDGDRRALRAGDLDGHGADPGAAAVDQHRLPGAQPGRHHQVRPHRAGHLGQAGGGDQVDAVGHRQHLHGGHDDPLRRSRRRPAARTPRRRPASRSPRARPRRSPPSTPCRGSATPRAAPGTCPAACSRSARLTALAATSISTSPGPDGRVGNLRPAQRRGPEPCRSMVTAHIRPRVAGPPVRPPTSAPARPPAWTAPRRPAHGSTSADPCRCWFIRRFRTVPGCCGIRKWRIDCSCLRRCCESGGIRVASRRRSGHGRPGPWFLAGRRRSAP